MNWFFRIDQVMVRRGLRGEVGTGPVVPSFQWQVPWILKGKRESWATATHL